MKRTGQMNVMWTFVACLLTTVRTRSVAYMDMQTRSANFTGCGDTIEGTLSGQVFSSIPRFSPDLNCSLALFSPPGTRLSLTVNEVKLTNLNVNTCGGGNRLMFLGSNTEGAMSLLPTFPHGLCGLVKPSQPIESTGNQVFLTLRSVQSREDSAFSISYTAFKTEPDGSCYECDVSGTRDTQFCIDKSLVCDGEQNCPSASYSEEGDPRCLASTPSPAGSSLGITVIVIIVILMVVLLAIIIFTILALMAKRVRSKRARESSVRRPHRSSQSRSRNTSQEGGGPPRQQHQRRPTPDSSHPGRGAPMFTSEGDQYTDLEFTERAVDYPRDPHPPVIMNPAGAPPPYSTLPRPFEESLQMADGTTPTSRSRLASINNDLENH
ncbi:uncharacterized protein LOC117306492 [Asterias rubens]|uniref:uncharacterized protein LOC117289620 n=1 Tax=Asterias rubens TaxID=7604 RepID=UPI00145568F2|nr:uncharacterized protein LOC117289620 [Asterias rubens]XP_033646931.1 uncharacterized protein LOC117306492 [Asterias rubens]